MKMILYFYLKNILALGSLRGVNSLRSNCRRSIFSFELLNEFFDSIFFVSARVKSSLLQYFFIDDEKRSFYQESFDNQCYLDVVGLTLKSSYFANP